VTDKAILEVEAETGELVLAALYPGVEVQDVESRIGWPLRSRAKLMRVEPPSERELSLLREVLDPERVYLKA